MAKRFVSSNPTANQALKNVERQEKLRPSGQNVRRRIVEEFPAVFADLNPAQRVTVTLAASRLAGGRSAWDITANHLEQAKADYFRDVR